MSVQCPLKQVFRGQKEDMKLNVKKGIAQQGEKNASGEQSSSSRSPVDGKKKLQ